MANVKFAPSDRPLGPNVDAEMTRSAALWLATQVLVRPRHGPHARSARQLIEAMLDAGHEAKALPSARQEMHAAESALLWMVLHGKPTDTLSRPQRDSLLPLGDDQRSGPDWAMALLDRRAIRPLLKQGRWWHRCRFAQRKFGFDFADAGVNFVWERIERYRDTGRGFRAWVETVLGHYWISLHRVWKRSVPKNSDAARELDTLAADDGHLRTRAIVRPKPGGGPAEPPALSASDVAAIAAWDPLDLVLMGCETGLWAAVPAAVWGNALRRVGIRESMAMTITATPVPRRRAALATALGVKRNTLAQRWKRLKPRVAGLDCIHALRGRNLLP